MITGWRWLIPLSLASLFLTACGGSASPGVTSSGPNVTTTSVPPCGIEGTGVHIQDCNNGGDVTGLSMTTARANHTATLLQDGKVLIAGGFSAAGPALASAELYDPSTGTFTATGDMISARGAHTAVLLANGKVLIVGGNTGGPPCSSVTSAELYDPSTGAFTAAGSNVTDSCVGIFSSLLPDGRVFIATFGNAEIYDPAAGSFALTGPYNTSVYAIYAATLLADGKILFAASLDSASNRETDELFDPKTNTFSPTGMRINATIPSTATLLTNGTVLFVEGLDSSNNVEIYDPLSGTFTVIGTTHYDHTGGTATRLDDGRVLIAGGELPGASEASQAYPGGNPGVELYDPATGTFVSAASLSTGRYGHTATLLTDGTVLIAGGYPSWGQPTASAEIYKKLTN